MKQLQLLILAICLVPIVFLISRLDRSGSRHAAFRAIVGGFANQFGDLGLAVSTGERALREKRANVVSHMKETRDAVDKDGWTDALRSAWDAADAEYVTLTGDIERESRDAALDSSFSNIDGQRSDVPSGPAGNNEEPAERYRSAFLSFVKRGLLEISPDERNLVAANFDADISNRAQGEATGGAGGYTVPQGFWAKITETMKYYGGMLDAAEVIDTETGQQLPWPTNDDTGNVGAILAENTQVTGLDVSFGQKNLSAYMYTSRLILVSLQLLQDAGPGIDLEGFIARKVGQRLGRVYNTHLTTGSGSSQPQGFVTGCTTGKTTASATAITFDEVIDLLHSVDVAYRNQGARWMLHDLVLAYIRKLKDGQSRYLWQPSPIAGVPDAIEGFPYTINNDMASAVATGNVTMAFGNFRDAYVARRVAGGQMMRLAERYADYLQVGFLGFGRLDGVVQDASAVKLMTQL
jgi:HK97 family phage major capsid protein